MSHTEIESLAAFDAALAPPSCPLVVQGVDLRERTSAIIALARLGHRHVFVGCALEPAAYLALVEGQHVVLPVIDGLPFQPFRPTLYAPLELFAGLAAGYGQTPDARAYRWFKDAAAGDDLVAQVAQALHDTSMNDALGELCQGKRLVGVMGGHKLVRGTPAYRDAARLGRGLARRGFVVATGGGPGAMEAANLGAHLAPHDDAALEAADARLAKAPRFDDVSAWAEAAFDVRRRFPSDATSAERGQSVGIPTWFYGHEPPNAFASHIAKYFANSVREDALLQRANAGIVFLPGAAGTVQEIFQDATQSYYGTPTRMVLVGRAHWLDKLPAWPLLQALAAGRPMAETVHLVDDVDAALALFGPDPESHRRSG